MANEWREILRTLPVTLLEACASDEADRLINLAIVKLQAQRDALSARRVGVADGYVGPDPAGVSAATLLEGSRRHITRCSTLHGLADSVVPAYVEVTGHAPSPAWADSWDNHNSDALSNGNAAQTSLCDAASLAKAATDAVELARALPEGDIIRIAWLLAAEQILNRAIDEVNRAQNRVREMQTALLLQFVDALSFLPQMDP